MLFGKRVVVTSSTRGIGRGVAEAFLRAGAKVFIGSRDPTAVKDAITSLRKIAPSVWGSQLDLTSPDSVEFFIEQVTSKLGYVDILILNSGNPSNEPANFSETTMDDWTSSVNLFLLSPIRLIRGFVGGMKERHWGRIIFLSSYTVKEPKDFFSLADVSRAPLIQLTKILSRELGEFGITVNTILMGTFLTPGAKKSIELLARRRGKAFEEVWNEEVLKPIPIKRIGDPVRDLGSLLIFLCQDEGSYITGGYILSDGGVTQAV